jgi:hypothetical protein
MGYIPIFIVMGGIVLLWGMTAYHTLKNKLEQVESLAKNLHEATPTQQQAHLAAIQLYNATVADGAAKFWAVLFGFKKIG